ncbi:MAG: hypothetical protein ACM3X3_09035 [Betaproteobacteria bacterium]
MPAGYSARCKVCNSPHRVQIEEWARKEGLSPRAISARLASEFGEPVSHKAVWRHLKDHFDVRAEARGLYEESKAKMEEFAGKRVSEVEELDGAIARAAALNRKVTALLDGMLPDADGDKSGRAMALRIPRSLVELYSATSAELRQHVKQKQGLLGDDPDSKLADAVVATLEELQELYQDANTRQEGTDS